MRGLVVLIPFLVLLLCGRLFRLFNVQSKYFRALELKDLTSPTTNITAAVKHHANAGSSIAAHQRQQIVHHINQNQPTTSCHLRLEQKEQLRLLGTNGTWVQDWMFAKQYGQHMTPRVIRLLPHAKDLLQLFQQRSRDITPYCPESSWRWLDFGSSTTSTNTIDSTSSTSRAKAMQIDHSLLSSPTRVCSILNRLGITRIAFYGDSLSKQQYMAFVNMMGGERVTAMGHPEIFHHLLNCSSSDWNNPNPIEVIQGWVNGGISKKISRDSDPHQPLQFTKQQLAFLDDRPSADELVLLIFNIGIHYHNLSLYQTDIDYAAQALAKIKRQGDVFFFRATAPGHYGCRPRSQRKGDFRPVEPLKSYKDYDFTVPDKYDWFLTESFNSYAKLKLNGELMHWLNVYNMTLLRPDGHMGGPDCLHYREFGGPVDHWNHLLMTYLNAMATGNCTTTDVAEKTAVAQSFLRGPVMSP